MVDPAFADGGKLYPIFDNAYVNKMKELVPISDYLIPNLTEACFLTDIEYKTEYDEEYIKKVCNKLLDMGAKNVVLTGVSYEQGFTGICVINKESYYYYKHPFLSNSCHGTGDIYASSFVGALMNGKTAQDSAKIAGDYTLECIKATAGDSSHWYGAKFEPCLPFLISLVK